MYGNSIFSKYIVDRNIHPCQIKTFTVYNEEYIHFALFSAKRLEKAARGC